MERQKKEPITVSDLLRNTSALLDEIEIDGASFVLHRYGRPVARIEPLEYISRRGRRPTRRKSQPEPVIEMDVPVDEEYASQVFESEPATALLKAIAAKGREGWDIAEGDGLFPAIQFAQALSILEYSRLVRSDGPWFWATREGMERAGG